MSEFKGTPGPWSGKDVGIFQQNRAGLQLGFITSSNEERVSECAANAMLIAVAPDLLAALQDLLHADCHSVRNSTVHNQAMHKAVAAISKATGE